MGTALDFKLPEQCPDTIEKLSDIIYRQLYKRNWDYADLARESGLSKATIHRLVTNSDNRGNAYHTTIEVVQALSIAFKLDDTESFMLFLAAFPQFPIWLESRRKKLDIIDTNDKLLKKGFPLITKTIL